MCDMASASPVIAADHSGDLLDVTDCQLTATISKYDWLQGSPPDTGELHSILLFLTPAFFSTFSIIFQRA
jgi:hypothetical protein